MLTYFYIALLIVAVAFAIVQIRQSLRDGKPLGTDPPNVDVNPFLEASSSSHHDVPTHGSCDIKRIDYPWVCLC
ncbi:MAG: hypothetical protein DMG46_14600 [Acidobacteria bacterium]|nr:MAG: hypothetical protein DMG46_14600 [Acidobacteriota bacterium]